MKIPLKKTSALLAVGGVTLILCVAFWLPIGGERLNKTSYKPLANVVATFAAAQDSLNTHLGGVPSVIDPKTSQGAITPPPSVLADSTITPVSGPGASGRKNRRAGRRHLAHEKKIPAVTVSTQSLRSSPPESPDKRPDAPSPIEGIPEPAVPVQVLDLPAEYNADLIRDAFEGELSKFTLDAKATDERVVLRLEGLCRWRGHYIVKVAVGNQTGADFFVKELSAYGGSELVPVKSYFRLLVEPGRTREGHVLFDAPRGAQVKIKLKEDREKGRIIELPVPYPF